MVHLICVKCSRANPSDAKFCSGCGASLLRKFCPQCHAVNGSDALFCATCGAGLPETPVPEALIPVRPYADTDERETDAGAGSGHAAAAKSAVSSSRSTPASGGPVEVELVEPGLASQAVGRQAGFHWAEPMPDHPLVPVAQAVGSPPGSHTARRVVLGVCTALVGAAAVLLWQRAQQPLEQAVTGMNKAVPAAALPAAAGKVSADTGAVSAAVTTMPAPDSAAPAVTQAQALPAGEARPAPAAKAAVQPAIERAPQATAPMRTPQVGLAKPSPPKALPVQPLPAAAPARQECTATVEALGLCGGTGKTTEGAGPAAPTGR